MSHSKITRRAAIGSAVSAVPLMMSAGQSVAQTTPEDTFRYEVRRTESEWKALLSEDEYKLLRQGATEPPKSHPMWDSTAAGLYSCKGCDLPIYDAGWKVVLDLGWLFFRHSEPNAVLTSIDRAVYDQFGDVEAVSEGPVLADADALADLTPEQRDAIQSFIAIEVHCRRCGSHFGHIVHAEDKLVHCVNGASFRFNPAG